MQSKIVRIELELRDAMRRLAEVEVEPETASQNEIKWRKDENVRVSCVVAVEDGVADFAVTVHIAVPNGRDKANLRRRLRVTGREQSREQPNTAGVQRRLRPLIPQPQKSNQCEALP